MRWLSPVAADDDTSNSAQNMQHYEIMYLTISVYWQDGIFTDCCLIFITFSAFRYKGSRLSTHGGKNSTERGLSSIRRASDWLSRWYPPSPNTSPASQEIPPPIHYANRRYINVSTTAPILHHTTTVHVSPPYFPGIVQILFSNLGTCIPNCLSPSGFTTNYCMHVSSPHHDPGPVHFILLDLTTLITYDKQYTSCSSSLCSRLQSPVTSSNLSLSRPTWQT